MKIFDNVLPEIQRKEVYDFLMDPGWLYGWMSDSKSNGFPFWHKHFAGALKPDTRETPYDCAAELNDDWCGPLGAFWQLLSKTILQGHTLVRCYANGFCYGNDGTVHVDAISTTSHTVIFFSHGEWNPNWGGETLFFDKGKTDVVSCVYPKPNRMILFPGTVPHVARGVSRVCPVMRISLMFKTEFGEVRHG